MPLVKCYCLLSLAMPRMDRGWVAGVDQREPSETTGAGVEISINVRHQIRSGGADYHTSTVPLESKR